MLLWLPISILAYTLNAVAGTVDKILLSKVLPSPKIYTFAIGVLNSVGLVLIPFGFEIIPPFYLAISFVIALFYIAALWLFFVALCRNDASRVVTVVGGIQPIIIFVIATLFLGEQLGVQEIIALVLFIIGGGLITYEFGKKHKKTKTWVSYALMSGVAFSIVHSLTKYLFNNVDFVSGFVWTRLMTVLVASAFLLVPGFWYEFTHGFKTTKPKNKGLFVIGQLSGAMFFVTLNYAISIGPVSLINGLQGIQYAFVLLMVMIFSRWYPKILKEKFTPLVLAQKVVAVLLIVIGIFLISI